MSDFAETMDLTKSRFAKLEQTIESGLRTFYEVGAALKEIRDDDLYKEDGFETWEKYCRERWDWSARHVTRLITASEYREKIHSESSDRTNWSESSVRELTRIPDKKQAARVAAKVVKAVEQNKKQRAKYPEVKEVKLSASTVRKFVDEDLGIDRAAKARETKKKNEEESKPRLGDYLRSEAGCIRVVAEKLAEISTDEWELLEEDEPGSAECLATACDQLAELLRS